MNRDELFQRYQELQSYVGWTEADAQRVRAAGALLEGHFSALIDDFYAEIERHPRARAVITEGAPQIERLKATLREWLVELFAGKYDAEYVARRWRVGYRHVEIGLDQVYTNVALSRLRTGMVRALQQSWTGSANELLATRESLNRLIDLDLAEIEEAYQTAHLARLQTTERLAAIGQVAGGVAHELRNPLNVVKTSVYYLLNARDPRPEKKLDHLRRIERQVGIADNVITALSNFARLPVPSTQPFSVEACLREALEANAPGENVEVQIDCPAAVPAALADRDQVCIVLGNLIRNAREAMPQGGRLTLSARSHGELLRIAVADTGEGIPADRLNRIMEPLYSSKARGIGLGLALARAILNKNNGSLSVTSTPGEGSTFVVHLAAAPDRAHDAGTVP